MKTVAREFEPGKHVTTVSGRDYLEVKWRLVWLRSEHPLAVIETAMQSLAEGMAVFKARVRTPDGAEATGWGSETASDFSDFIEKAETKALGRALAALGYGLQFCEDFDDSGDKRPAPRVDGRATASQVSAIYSIGRSLGMSAEDVDAKCRLEFGGRAAADVGRREASQFIDAMKAAAPAKEVATKRSA